MTYEQFMRDLWREMKRMAVEPLFSMGEIVLILAYLAYKPPFWLSAPILFVWMIWRTAQRKRHEP